MEQGALLVLYQQALDHLVVIAPHIQMFRAKELLNLPLVQPELHLIPTA
jgi:hypothetical protein